MTKSKKNKKPEKNKKVTCSYCKNRTRNILKHLSICSKYIKAVEKTKPIQTKKIARTENLDKRVLHNMVNIVCYYCGGDTQIFLNGTTSPDLSAGAMRVNGFVVHTSCYDYRNPPVDRMPKYARDLLTV